MNYRVQLTDRAEAQLYEAAYWWAKHHSLKEALRWLAGFQSELGRPNTDPERFPLASEAARVGIQLRQLNYGVRGRKNHRALFEVRDNDVLVHTIRHLAQDDVSSHDIS